MKRVIVLLLVLLVAAPALAAIKPGGSTTVTCDKCPDCPPPTEPECREAFPPAPPTIIQPTRDACVALFPPPPPEPARSSVQPGPVSALPCAAIQRDADRQLALHPPMAGPPPRGRVARIVPWIVGAIAFRHVVLSLDDDERANVVQVDGHGHGPCQNHECHD